MLAGSRWLYSFSFVARDTHWGVISTEMALKDMGPDVIILSETEKKRRVRIKSWGPPTF